MPTLSDRAKAAQEPSTEVLYGVFAALTHYDAMLFLVDRNGCVLAGSEKFIGIFEARFNTPCIGANLFAIDFPHPYCDRIEHLKTAIRTNETQSFFDQLGDTHHWHTVLPIPAERGWQSKYFFVSLDITEQKKREAERLELEQRLVGAQKLSLLGKMAGGIAHDFNNILASIQGNAEMMLADTNEGDPRHPNLASIVDACQRSASLVSQLLGFARKSPNVPVDLALDQELKKISILLRNLLPERIELHFDLNCPDVIISHDPTNLLQILTNLVVNARDAITEQGSITITTRTIPSSACYNPQCCAKSPEERCVKLTVQDNGQGIAPEVLPHIFEPFCTTKTTGASKGSGLGLATAYGLVKQNDGYITCQSEEGTGTTIAISLAAKPLTTSTHPETPPEPDPLQRTAGKTILIVEDEKEIAALLRLALEKQGYPVIVHENAENALEALNTLTEKIDLIISDVVLPGMNGLQMARIMQEQHPESRFLFISGFSEDVLASYREFNKNRNFLPKPFEIRLLLEKVREILESSGK